MSDFLKGSTWFGFDSLQEGIVAVLLFCDARILVADDSYVKCKLRLEEFISTLDSAALSKVKVSYRENKVTVEGFGQIYFSCVSDYQTAQYHRGCRYSSLILSNNSTFEPLTEDILRQRLRHSPNNRPFASGWF